MASNTPISDEGDLADTPEAESGYLGAPRPHKMTRRQRRRRIILLTVLLLLLALLSLATYYFVQNRALPSISLTPPAAGLAPPEYLFSMSGQGVNELQRPAGIEVAPDGRVYTVSFNVTDSIGGVTQAQCRFQVVHDQGHGPAVDSGNQSCVSSVGFTCP